MTKLSAVLDFQLALKAVNGNADLAKDLLSTLIGQFDNYQTKISDSLVADNRQQLQDTIHKINGAMRYVGTPLLADKIAYLDGEILTMPGDTLAEQIKEVLTEIKKIIELGCYPE